MFSKTSSVRQILDLELKALKEQEELQTRLGKLRREAKENEIVGLQEEIAGLQEEMSRKTRIAKKEIERAKVRVVVGPAFEVYHRVGHQTTM